MSGKTKFTAVPGKQEVIVTREFDAPRELVWKVMTDPGKLPEWWGPRNLSTEVEKMELRPGGQWRYIQCDADGHEYGFHGVYHTVQAPERTISTFEFEGVPGHVLLETTILEEQDGKTLLTNHVVYQSVEDRDGMIATGMEWGQSEGFDRLEELLVKV